jgi:HD-like signal output (HDOD) protein
LLKDLHASAIRLQVCSGISICGAAKTITGEDSVIENFREKVEQTIDLLPPMPSIVGQLLSALKGDDADFRVIGRIISKDPSMAMNVLKIANSALFGLAQKVTSLDQAVMMLGTNEMVSLCISCGAVRSLAAPQGVRTMDLERFWRHSVATGVIAKIICRQLKASRGDDLYLAGLTHDVGAVVLDRFKHDVYQEVLDLTHRENISVLEAEQRIMGASHDAAGSWLMQKWQLPEVFVEVAAYHHAVTRASQKHMVAVALISLADLLARLTLHGFDGNMDGVVVTDTDAFKVLRKKYPPMAHLDVVKLVWDLHSAQPEIDEMEGILKGSLPS